MSFWSLHFRCLYRVSFWAQARFTLIFLHHFYLKSLQGKYFLYTTAICQVFLSGCGSLFQTYQTLQRPHRGKIWGKKKQKTHPQITDCLCRGGISIFLCMEKETILFSNALKSRRYACGQFWVFESLMRQSLSATCAPVWFNKAQTNIELFFFFAPATLRFVSLGLSFVHKVAHVVFWLNCTNNFACGPLTVLILPNFLRGWRRMAKKNVSPFDAYCQIGSLEYNNWYIAPEELWLASVLFGNYPPRNVAFADSASLYFHPTANPHRPQRLGVRPGLRPGEAVAAQWLSGRHAEGVERRQLHSHRRSQRTRQPY